MKQSSLLLLTTGFLVSMACLLPTILAAANAQILGWNNRGMHCMNSNYSVFSILPPCNTIEAQLILAGKLITNETGYTVTYQAVSIRAADPIQLVPPTAAPAGGEARLLCLRSTLLLI